MTHADRPTDIPNVHTNTLPSHLRAYLLYYRRKLYIIYANILGTSHAKYKIMPHVECNFGSNKFNFNKNNNHPFRTINRSS